MATYLPPSNRYFGPSFSPWFHISRLILQLPSASRCSTSSIFPRPSNGGLPRSGGCTTWCSNAHSDAQSPLTSIPRKSSSIFSIRQPCNRAVTSSRNLAISGFPTRGAVSGSKLTPSSAHMRMIAGVSILQCASRNFALNAKISLRRPSPSGACAVLPSLGRAMSANKPTAGTAAAHAAKTLRIVALAFSHPFASVRLGLCGVSSISQLQRKLNLPRAPRRFVDDSEAASADHIVRQPEIHNVENVEKFCPNLQDAKLVLSASAKRRILDQAEIEIVVRRSAERAPSQGSKPAAVGTGSSRQVGRNAEQRSVVVPQPEIVLAHRPAGREIRFSHRIGPIRARRSEPS